ncbi:MAG: DegV family protein, partial [Anaerolineaceae bacterium]
MPHRVALITDSTCDIPAEWRQQYEIIVVPLTIVFGNEQYLDGVDMQPEAFYARLLSDPTHPTSYQPTPQMFLGAFEQAEAHGGEEMMVGTISSALG